MVETGVVVVLGQRGGKVVAPRHVFFGTHVDVVVLVVVEDRFNGSFRGNAYGAGREAVVFVGVVGRVDTQVLPEYAFDAEVTDGKFDGRVGLQGNALSQPVDVEPRNDRHLVGDIGLLFDNRGECGDLYGAEARFPRFLATLVGPIPFIFAFHAVEQTLGRNVPIHIIGVGQEHGGNVVGRKTLFGAIGFVVHDRQQLVGR